MVIQNDRDLEGAIHNARRMATDRVSVDLKKTSEQLDRLRRKLNMRLGDRAAEVREMDRDKLIDMNNKTSRQRILPHQQQLIDLNNSSLI